MAKKCSHEDTRLSCIDCNAPICGNCLVQCPVGNRCTACGTGSGEQAKKPAVTGGVKLFALSAVIGAGGGWAMSFFSIPLLNCFLYFFVGLVAGRWLANFIDYQWRDRAGKVIVLGTLLGMCFSPLAGVPPAIFGLMADAFITSPQNIIPGLSNIVGTLFTPVLFIVGILRPTAWSGY